jgi:ketosteroid isomerase-like protein
MDTTKTMDIARQLVALCQQGKNEEALQTLCSPDLVSVEAMAMEGGKQESVGMAAVKAKGEWWFANHEIHSAAVTGPWPNGNRFIVGFQYDVTFKPTGKRMKLDEVGLYTIEGGKIVREEFFYDMGG